MSSRIQLYQLKSLRCNCFVIKDDSQCYLIDTSVSWERRTIELQLKQLGIRHLSGIIITHVHSDHVGNAAFFQKKYHCPVYVSQEEIGYLLKGRCKAPQGNNTVAKTMVAAMKRLNLWETFEPCILVQPIHNRIFPIHWKGMVNILPIPGHTEGSISVLIKNQSALVGDAMVHMRKGSIEPGFVDLPEELGKSWKRLFNTKCSVFYPSHGQKISSQLLEKNIEKI